MIKYTAPKMRQIAKDHRKANDAMVARAKDRASLRWDHERSTDLPLVTICLGAHQPKHIKEVRPGVFAVDLPADTWKMVFMTSDGFWVGTFRTRADRDGAL